MFCSCMHVRDYVLADFGLAKEGIAHGHKGAGSFCGTAEYLAPEMIKRIGHGTAVDWWALGMVLFEMLSGFPPWYKHGLKTSEDREAFFHDVTNEELKFPPYMSPNSQSIISGTDQFDLFTIVSSITCVCSRFFEQRPEAKTWCKRWRGNFVSSFFRSY